MNLDEFYADTCDLMLEVQNRVKMLKTELNNAVKINNELQLKLSDAEISDDQSKITE